MSELEEFERKVQRINKILGTRYNAVKVLEREKSAREYGYTTSDYARIESIPDDAGTDVGWYLLKTEFRALGEKQAQVGTLLEAKEGDYIDRGGHVWRQYRMRDGSTKWTRIDNPSITRDAIDKHNFVRARPKNVYKKIKQIRDRINERSKRTPQHAYDDVPLWE